MGNCCFREEKKPKGYYEQFLEKPPGDGFEKYRGGQPQEQQEQQHDQPGATRVVFGSGSSRVLGAPPSIEQVEDATFNARYDLRTDDPTARLGEGHMARVYRATERVRGGQQWAVKVIRKERRCLPRNCQCTMHVQVRREVAVLGALQHPHVVRLKDVLETPTSIFIVTELLRGRELFDVVASRHHFSEKEAAAVVRRLASALCYMHSRGVAHRDLKPENVMFSAVDEHLDSLKIIDFGFSKCFLGQGGGEREGEVWGEEGGATGAGARAQDKIRSAHRSAGERRMQPGQSPRQRPASFHHTQDSDARALRTRLGTPGYIAPEVQSGRPYDKACDVWSLGILTYALLCGYLPFEATTPDGIATAAAGAGGKRKSSPRKRFALRFPKKEWSAVSSEAKHFCSQMLTVQAAQRLTAAQLLQHPWLFCSAKVEQGESGEWHRGGGENRISLSTVEKLRSSLAGASEHNRSVSRRLKPHPDAGKEAEKEEKAKAKKEKKAKRAGSGLFKRGGGKKGGAPVAFEPVTLDTSNIAKYRVGQQVSNIGNKRTSGVILSTTPATPGATSGPGQIVVGGVMHPSETDGIGSDSDDILESHRQ